MIKNEEGFRAGFVYVDFTGRDIGSYVDDARRAVEASVEVPPGYHVAWSGQYEYMLRVRERLALVVPITLVLIALLLYFNTRSVMETSIVLLAVPFSAVGAILFLWALDYNTSVAVWVGLIALLGVDAETGVFMLLYLRLAHEKAKEQGRLRDDADLRQAIMEGAVQRLRPKVMTVSVMVAGLLPILWSNGAGSDVMRRIAVPMIGGIFSSFLMELVVYPVIFEIWKERELPARQPT
jgi:Cu(I)/Ag(I) efflux system membrane protein CusA/SilA